MSKEFAIGERVQIIALPPYVKTADPMPMLRPADIVHLGEQGTVLNRLPGGYWSVRFTKGAFLMDSQYLEVVETTPTPVEPHTAATENAPSEQE